MKSDASGILTDAKKSIQALTDLAESALSQSDRVDLETARQALARFELSMTDEPGKTKEIPMDFGITPVHQGTKKVLPVY